MINVSFQKYFHLHSQVVSEKKKFSLVKESDFETTVPMEVSAILKLSELSEHEASSLQLILNTNCSITFALSLAYESKSLSVEAGIGIGYDNFINW